MQLITTVQPWAQRWRLRAQQRYGAGRARRASQLDRFASTRVPSRGRTVREAVASSSSSSSAAERVSSTVARSAGARSFARNWSQRLWTGGSSTGARRSQLGEVATATHDAAEGAVTSELAPCHSHMQGQPSTAALAATSNAGEIETRTSTQPESHAAPSSPRQVLDKTEEVPPKRIQRGSDISASSSDVTPLSEQRRAASRPVSAAGRRSAASLQHSGTLISAQRQAESAALSDSSKAATQLAAYSTHRATSLGERSAVSHRLPARSSRVSFAERVHSGHKTTASPAPSASCTGSRQYTDDAAGGELAPAPGAEACAPWPYSGAPARCNAPVKASSRSLVASGQVSTAPSRALVAERESGEVASIYHMLSASEVQGRSEDSSDAISPASPATARRCGACTQQTSVVAAPHAELTLPAAAVCAASDETRAGEQLNGEASCAHDMQPTPQQNVEQPESSSLTEHSNGDTLEDPCALAQVSSTRPHEIALEQRRGPGEPFGAGEGPASCALPLSVSAPQSMARSQLFTSASDDARRCAASGSCSSNSLRNLAALRPGTADGAVTSTTLGSRLRTVQEPATEHLGAHAQGMHEVTQSAPCTDATSRSHQSGVDAATRSPGSTVGAYTDAPPLRAHLDCGDESLSPPGHFRAPALRTLAAEDALDSSSGSSAQQRDRSGPSADHSVQQQQCPCSDPSLVPSQATAAPRHDRDDARGSIGDLQSVRAGHAEATAAMEQENAEVVRLRSLCSERERELCDAVAAGAFEETVEDMQAAMATSAKLLAQAEAARDAGQRDIQSLREVRLLPVQICTRACVCVQELEGRN